MPTRVAPYLFKRAVTDQIATYFEDCDIGYRKAEEFPPILRASCAFVMDFSMEISRSLHEFIELPNTLQKLALRLYEETNEGDYLQKLSACISDRLKTLHQNFDVGNQGNSHSLMLKPRFRDSGGRGSSEFQILK